MKHETSGKFIESTSSDTQEVEERLRARLPLVQESLAELEGDTGQRPGPYPDFSGAKGLLRPWLRS